MKRQTKQIMMISLILVFVMFVVLLLIQNTKTRESWDNHTFKYNERYDVAENLEHKLRDYLKQDRFRLRSDAIIKKAEVISVDYDSMTMYRAELDITYHKNKGHDEPFKEGRHVVYIDAVKMIDTINVKEVIQEAEFEAYQAKFNTRDVVVEIKTEEQYQVKDQDGLIHLSNNYGSSWLNTGFPFTSYINEHSFIYEENFVSILRSGSNGTILSTSVDGGTNWMSQVIFMNDYDKFWDPFYVYGDEHKVVFIGVVDHAMGSVHNKLVRITIESSSTSDFVSTKPIVAKTIVDENHFFVGDVSGRVYESRNGGITFNELMIPHRDEDVWGFPFNEIFTHASVPKLVDNVLTLHVTQGPTGDVKANAMAEFILNNKDEWEFTKYLLLQDEIVD